MGVSRTPVREALHKLEQDGLIEPLGGRGFCIPRDSAEEIEDLFETPDGAGGVHPQAHLRTDYR